MSIKVAFLCTFSTVPRTLRMARILASVGCEIHIIEWDREGVKPKAEIENGILFKRLRLKAGYGLGAFYLIPIWMIFAFFQIVVGGYQIVQPQNLDCLIPTYFAAGSNKRVRIIYDLADFYEAYVADLPLISMICVLLEKALIRHVDAAILASDRQILQVKRKNLPKNVMLFFNAPEVEQRCLGHEDRRRRDIFELFYAGILSYDRISLLMNVVQAIRGLPVRVVIAGFGTHEGLIRRLTKANKQMVFLGNLDHEKVMELTRRSDLTLLPYDPSSFNNRIGLPSKFFESMACGSLMLAQRRTYMSEIVEREGIGIVVDFTDLAEVRRVIESLINGDRNDIQLRVDRAKKLYARKFDPQRTDNRYVRMVQLIASK